jgi:hypothetical protein
MNILLVNLDQAKLYPPRIQKYIGNYLIQKVREL